MIYVLATPGEARGELWGPIGPKAPAEEGRSGPPKVIVWLPENEFYAIFGAKFAPISMRSRSGMFPPARLDILSLFTHPG
jgi:hypothetical protein